MRKMLDSGVSLRKSFAQGDGELFYPDGNYEDDARAPVQSAGSPATPLGATTGETFRATGPMGEMVVAGLNKWAAGGFSAPDAPGAPVRKR